VDPRFGSPGGRRVARIEEERCIGCTLCIQACPVDAIVGAPRLMHTVIADVCTGCELCIPPCPVDCIALMPATERDADAKRATADEAHRRFEARTTRLERAREEATRKAHGLREANAQRKKQEVIAEAVRRARQRLAARGLDGKR
jgi:electron transport complex protein RnfB